MALHIDPEATLRLWPVDVEVAGRVYTIPAMPARPWLLALHGTWQDVVPAMLGPDTDDLRDSIIDETIDAEECTNAARAAVEAVAGCRWWIAAKLAHTFSGEIGGELLIRGVDPDRVPLGAWLLSAYSVATRGGKPEDVARLDAELETPPSGLDPDVWWDDTAANDAFAAAMGGR